MVAAQNEPKPANKLIKEVRHELVMLPYYSVFDNLEYRVEGDKVVAEFRNGVLTLMVPKRPEVRPRKISVHLG